MVSKVTFSDTIRPACLPDDPSTTFAYEVGFECFWKYLQYNIHCIHCVQCIIYTVYYTVIQCILSLQSGIISGWGYTETTKILKPRPLTSDVLREAEIYILPQANI